jgi:hypothetical protein
MRLVRGSGSSQGRAGGEVACGTSGCRSAVPCRCVRGRPGRGLRLSAWGRGAVQFRGASIWVAGQRRHQAAAQWGPLATPGQLQIPFRSSVSPSAVFPLTHHPDIVGALLFEPAGLWQVPSLARGLQ